MTAGLEGISTLLLSREAVTDASLDEFEVDSRAQGFATVVSSEGGVRQVASHVA